jgi:ATP-dependent helicase/nuclease subunit A
MEIARDEVRVMTVHGAKGLEAPIVILADTTTEPQGPLQHQPRLLGLSASQAGPDAPDQLVWAPTKREDTAPIATARAAAVEEAIDEYRRLLYVAMTRAADRLVVCGSVGVNRRPQGCWYDLIADALKPHCNEEPADVGDGTVLRYRKAPPMPEALSLFEPKPSRPPSPERPGWLDRKLPATSATPSPLSPSQIHDETSPVPRTGGATRRQAMARGVAMHRLLQSLPAIAPEHRTEAARRYLAGKRDDFTAGDSDDLARKALALIARPDFSALFSPESRAEVPIVGHIVQEGQRRAVTGVVDRLVVTEDAILIADYKTNRDPPKTPAEVPEGYIAQLALYRAVLARLYPGKTVCAALIWTEVPDLMEISSAALDQALAALTSS